MTTQQETPVAPAKELTAQETGLLLKRSEQDVALLKSQLKVQRLRVLQLEATNRMLMLVCLAFALGCAKLVFDMQRNPSLLPQQQPSSQTINTHEEEICDLIVHYDTQFGAGVYAGRHFHTKEIFQEMTGIPGKFTHLEGTIFDDFGEGYNDTHGSFTLGYALVFNHVGSREDKMVEKFNTGWVSMYFENGEASTDGHYEAARNVTKGEQIFSYYGDDWFDYRTFDEISPAAVGSYYLKMADPFHGSTRVPGCPTTTLQVVNGHVYANKPFRKGETIEVARGLLLPEEAMGGAGHIEEFAWFSEVSADAPPLAQVGLDEDGDPVLVPPGSSVGRDVSNDGYHLLSGRFVLLLLGYGLLYRGTGTIADVDNAPNLTMLAKQNRALSNVDYDWWSVGKYVEYLAPSDVENENRPKTPEVDMTIDGQGQGLGQVSENQSESGTAKQRVKVPLPGLKQTYGGHGHLQSLLTRKTNKPPGVEGGCWDRMFVVFTASRDIAVGEELLIDFVTPATSNNDNNSRTGNVDDHDDVMRRYVPSQPGQFGSYCLS